MSGSTIGGVVGGIIGAFFGQPQLGFMIGSMIGGYVDPDQVYGPRLTDAQTQTSQVGVPMAIIYGTSSVKGNIIAAERGVREKKKKQRAGKGGPEQVTYQYLKSYAIGICEGPIKAIKTIKRNGKVVYEAGLNAAGEYTGDTSSLSAVSRKFLQKCKIYIGDETQMPDPTLEALFGVGNVAPHRGVAYIVVKDDDLTELQGAVPQYDFVVVMEGTIGQDIATEIAPGRMSEFADVLFPLVDDESQYTYEYFSYANSTGTPIASIEDGLNIFRAGGRDPHYIGYSYSSPTSVTLGIGLDVSATGVSNFNSQPSVVNNKSLVLVFNDLDATELNDTATGTWCPTTISGQLSQNRRGTVSKQFSSNPGAPWILVESCAQNVYSLFSMQIRVTRKRVAPLSPPRGAEIVPDMPGYYVTANGELKQIQNYTEVFGTYKVLSVASGSGNLYSWYENEPVIPVGDPDFNNQTFWTSSYNSAVSAGKVPSGWVYNIDYPVTVSSAFEGETEVLPTIDRDRIALGSIVADLCDRSGLTYPQYDVSQLTDLVDGYVVATVGGANSFISPLSQAYFFDPSEWDAKLRFIKRGGSAVFSLGPDDMAERDGPAIEIERVQEPELLRKTTIAYIDPKAGFTPATQVAERRAATVQAKGESAIELPVAMTSEDAARAADKRIKVAWGEPEKFIFNWPYRFVQYTPTDVGTLTDKQGKIHRIRLMDIQEDSGILILEASRDSQSSYVSNVEGIEPSPPTVTAPGLIGGTRLEILNIPVLRDEHDQLGLYIAAAGQLPGWTGAEIQISTNGGVSGDTFATITTAATIGYTITSLAATVPDYPAEQAVDVFLPDPPESVDYPTLLRFYNRAVIGDEIIQYQTVTDLGNNTYRLSGLVRNRYDTVPANHAAGVRFVLIDSSLLFVQAQQWMLGQSLSFRAVSFGTSADAYAWQPYEFTKGVSQTEWQPKMVRANDVGSDIVVTWLGRGRLGTPSNAYHSQYFRGYRVTYTNGGNVTTHDVIGTTDTLVGGASLPGAVTITVAGINSITGAGTLSEVISA
jgi:hypothetical protein